MTKRDATEIEINTALLDLTEFWNSNNTSFEKTIEYWQNKQQEAVSEGYKAEVCSCGLTFLAFHHFTTCKQSDCPFSDGVSILQRMIENDSN